MATSLKASASIVLDGEFVVSELKIIQGDRGLFVSMPSRKRTDHCPSCGAKNPVDNWYCSECQVALDPERAGRNGRGRLNLYADLAHPINQSCRDKISRAVLDEYRKCI